jgi:hypothetical protein
LLEVSFELGDEKCGNGDRPAAGVALRRPEHEQPVAELVLLLLDRHERAEHVDAAAFEAEELAEPEPAEAGEEHEDPQVAEHRVGNCEDLRDRRHGRSAVRSTPAPSTLHGFQ